MRIGIIALLHESNTFSSQLTTIDRFRDDLWLEGDAIRAGMADTHHEVGGFFAGLAEISRNVSIEVVPILVARALPSGTITADAYAELMREIRTRVQATGRLDGLLVAAHGAAVSQSHPDADGHLLSTLREQVGPQVGMVCTLDLHANLSAMMVRSCDALVAYRTNPHLDQRERGHEAAVLLVNLVLRRVRPTMSAILPPLAINIQRQCTDDSHLKSLYRFAEQQRFEGAVTNSILLGFPYADVAEMGSSVLVVTDDDPSLADQLAVGLADRLWRQRDELQGKLTSVEEALNQCETLEGPIALLDMGDNVGGGSAADGTELIDALHRRKLGPCFACLYDPEAVEQCDLTGAGEEVDLRVGGKTDQLHGQPMAITGHVRSLHSGMFFEHQPRHGGMSDFNQGRTAIVQTDRELTLMLTSRRMVPFSLQQLISCDVNPAAFRILVAKGVNAPIAAYADVCSQFIRVNSGGATCADLTRLDYSHRRQSLYPLELDVIWQPETSLVRGFDRAGEVK